MIFKTLEEYNDKIIEIKKEKYEIEQYLKRNPHDLKKQKHLEILEKYINNYETQKEIYIDDINKFNLKLTGNISYNIGKENNFFEICAKFNDTINSASKLLNSNSDYEELLLRGFTSEVCKITFGFQKC